MSREKLEKLHMTFQEFMKLPEYSASIPTGVIIGKRWRRHNGSHDQIFIRRGGKPYWVICEYVEHKTDPAMATIKRYRPVVRIKAPGIVIPRYEDQACAS